MGLTIWKQVLALESVQDVMLPRGAEILCANEQHGKICIWFRCDTSLEKEPRPIAVVATGHTGAAGVDGRYLGTAAIASGQFIFHIFEGNPAHAEADGGLVERLRCGCLRCREAADEIERLQADRKRVAQHVIARLEQEVAQLRAAVSAERNRCAEIVRKARLGEGDGDLRSIIHAIEVP